MHEEDAELPKGADEEAGSEPDTEGYVGELVAEEGALVCPIIHLSNGGVSACLSAACALWIPEGDGLPAACGFKFLSMYARFEMARMARMPEMID